MAPPPSLTWWFDYPPVLWLPHHSPGQLLLLLGHDEAVGQEVEVGPTEFVHHPLGRTEIFQDIGWLLYLEEDPEPVLPGDLVEGGEGAELHQDVLLHERLGIVVVLGEESGQVFLLVPLLILVIFSCVSATVSSIASAITS